MLRTIAPVFLDIQARIASLINALVLHLTRQTLPALDTENVILQIIAFALQIILDLIVEFSNASA